MEIFDLFLQFTSSVPLLGSLVVSFLIYIISTSSFRFQQDRMEPPGPKALPLLGNLLQFDLKTPHNTLMKLSKKYGSVFTVYMGPKKVVVLAGYKTVKEALVNFAEEFGDRDPMQIMTEFSQGNGITRSNGEIWKEMRRFAVTNLKDFGMGKKVCEDKIIEECHQLIEVLKKFKGEALDTTQPIHHAVSNIICSMVYGNRFEYADPQFISMLECMRMRVKLAGSPSIQVYNLFPWFFKWVADRKEFHQVNVFDRKQNLEIFNSLKKTLNPQMCRGFVDAFLVRKQNLKGTTVYPLLASVLYDESEWENPYSFYPAHFLDKDGKFVKREAFMAFSAGRRVCPGESLARMELFILFVTLLQHFRFTPPPGVSEDELNLYTPGSLMRYPTRHKLCAVCL